MSHHCVVLPNVFLSLKFVAIGELKCLRLRGMSTAQLVALIEVTRAYWRLSHLDTDIALQQAGAKIAGEPA
jgi:hypothetical protein